MFSKPIQTLIDFFLKFPGVGPRQAARFVFYLLREDKERAKAMAETISRLHDDVKLCAQCFKTFDANHNQSGGLLCEFCRSPRRNAHQILVVEKEADLENIERARKYDGMYHVLGGTISPLDSSAPTRLHVKELFERIRKLASSGQAVEMILATNPTAEGEATAMYLERVFAPLKHQHAGLTLSRLGRGLSTGSELEYSDDITIANALQNRK
ncbi:MAG: recombination mediator RecR [Patescibacteria group bacterium]